MKKSILSALTTAFVIGTASTTFAAANPFSDVPANHWAYDAVSRLAADGIIDGYGDGTFRGSQLVTRYEMAQMIVRALYRAQMIDDTAAINQSMNTAYSVPVNENSYEHTAPVLQEEVITEQTVTITPPVNVTEPPTRIYAREDSFEYFDDDFEDLDDFEDFDDYDEDFDEDFDEDYDEPDIVDIRVTENRRPATPPPPPPPPPQDYNINRPPVERVEISAASKRDLERLAEEFRDELDGFGVRLANLEKNQGKLTWTGEARYRYWNLRKAKDASTLQLRLFPTIKIDDKLTIKSRLTGSFNMKTDNTSGNDFAMTFGYLEGKFKNFTVNAGKMPLYTNVDKGMIADDFFSGLQLVSGKKDDALKFNVNLGHWSKVGADYLGAEGVYALSEDMHVGAGYHYFKEGDDKAKILALGGDYKVNDDWSVNAAFAHNSDADDHKTAYNFEADYLGAKRSEVGSWGAFAAYRHVGNEVGFAPTYDSFAQSQSRNKKGFDIGGTFTPYKDTLLKLSYFHGKNLTTKSTDRVLFARASVFF